MDLIDRQTVIEALKNMAVPRYKDPLCEDIYERDRTLNNAIDAMKALPSAQPERLTDDDFETIRIHLNACKEKLCNQQRWEEAEEYQRIIDRFMAFASAQPGIIHCKDCMFKETHGVSLCCDHITGDEIMVMPSDFCSWAERRQDEYGNRI